MSVAEAVLHRLLILGVRIPYSNPGEGQVRMAVGRVQPDMQQDRQEILHPYARDRGAEFREFSKISKTHRCPKDGRASTAQATRCVK
jgi:hypothetical protein